MNAREANEWSRYWQTSSDKVGVSPSIGHKAMLRRALLVVFVSEPTNSDDATRITRVIFNF